MLIKKKEDEKGRGEWGEVNGYDSLRKNCCEELSKLFLGACNGCVTALSARIARLAACRALASRQVNTQAEEVDQHIFARDSGFG